MFGELSEIDHRKVPRPPERLATVSKGNLWFLLLVAAKDLLSKSLPSFGVLVV
jgi:hypothetical protein